jgi:hypothetical protein
MRWYGGFFSGEKEFENGGEEENSFFVLQSANLLAAVVLRHLSHNHRRFSMDSLLIEGVQ